MLDRNENIIYEKVEAFTDRIIKMIKYLRDKRADNTMIGQVNRSGLSIGANVSEAKYAQSRPDFISKMSIALKEAGETKYWIRKLFFGGYLSEKEFNSIYADNDEIVAILYSIIHTTKNNDVKN